MKKYFLLVILLSILFDVSAQGDLPVDLHSGTPQIHIPLWTVSGHGLSQSIGLYYNASGIKLEQRPDRVGLGWSITGIGRISREVRGLPDDFDGLPGAKTQSVANCDPRRGWLHPPVFSSNTAAKDVLDFTPSSDLSEATCSDEQADYTKLSQYLEVDTEPDIFHFSAGEISGSFVFDNSNIPVIRLIPHQDLVIKYTRNEITKDIIAFTITTNQGTTYYFDRPVQEEQSVKNLETGSIEFYNVFARQFSLNVSDDYCLQQFSGHLPYNSGWMLTRIRAVNGSEITYQYSEKPFEIRDSVKVGIRKDNASSIDVKAVSETYYKLKEQRLNLVRTSSGEILKLIYKDSLLNTVQVIDERRTPSSLVKEFVLSHKEVTGGRKFLETITERGGDIQLPPYKFVYEGVFFSTSQTYLPSNHSKAKDFWGYYNGKKANTTLYPTMYVYPSLNFPNKVRVDRIPGYSGQELILPGADRTPDLVACQVGSLSSIQYPSGGSTYIRYELNSYYDSIAGATFHGGGLRIRSVSHFDGINPDAVMYKEFNYDAQPGQSSGRLISPPVFFIPTSKYVSANGSIVKTYAQLTSLTAQEIWERLLARTEQNLSEECYVSYKKVTVLNPGFGKTVTEFRLPAAGGVESVGEWSATINKFSRSNTCDVLGIFNTGGSWRFPYTRNPNYSHARGLPTRLQKFSETGGLVQETVTTYQQVCKSATTPTKVYGLTFEKFPHAAAFFFGKYFLLTDVMIVPKTQTTTTWALDAPGKSLSQSTTYLYDVTSKLPIGTQTTHNDGTVYRTIVKYPRDYGVVPPTTDKPTLALKNLQRWRNGTPIETYSSIQKPGLSEYVLSAQYVSFNEFNDTTAVVESTYSVVPGNGLPLTQTTGSANFWTASIQNSGGVQKITPNSNYELMARVLTYSSPYKIPMSSENVLGKSISGLVSGYNFSLPIAAINDALPDNIAFSDFETTSNVSFSQSAAIYGKGRTGENGIHPSVVLTRTLTKAATNNYRLSFWIKTNGTSVTFDLIIRNSTNQVLSTTPITANSSTVNVYKRFEKEVTVNLAEGASFSVEFKGQLPPGSYTSSPSLLPVIDDVMFCPENADMVTTTFSPPYGATSATDLAGRTNFNEFDPLGRHKLSRDMNGNITSRSAYKYSSLPDVLTNVFALFEATNPIPIQPESPGQYYVRTGQTVRLVAAEESHENVTYEWNFGSGFTVGQRVMDRTFTPGTTTVTLRVSKSGYTTVTSNATVRGISNLSVCAEGIREFRPSTGAVISSFPDCTLITIAPPSNAVFFRLNDTEVIPIGTIRWKIRDIGSDNWITIGSASNQLQVTDVNQKQIGFEVICEIWNNGVLLGQSNTTQVKFIL